MGIQSMEMDATQLVRLRLALLVPQLQTLGEIAQQFAEIHLFLGIRNVMMGA